jgi:O-antigen/teichoic acid export membrane protein
MSLAAPMSGSFGHRSFRLFSSSILDQVLLSATNFLVGFLLIRFANDQDYALYILVQSAVLLVTSMHNAWLMGPLSVLAPKLPVNERWLTVGSIKLTQRRWLARILPLLLLVPLAGYLINALSSSLAVVSALGIVAAWMAMRREFLRNVLLIYSRPNTLLGVDTVYALCLLAGVVAVILIGKQVVIGATGALAVASWASGFAAHRYLGTDPGWREETTVSIWRDIGRLGFWAVLGSTIWWFLGQSYSYMLATRLDLTAVANVNVARLLVAPMFVLTIGVGSLLAPTAATWYAEVGIRALVRRLLLFLLVVGFIEIAYFSIVWICRDWLLVTALHKHIQDRDRLLILWGIVAIIALCRDVLQCGLFALGKFRSLAWQVGVSTAIALAVMWFGIQWWSAAAVVFGQIVGEIIDLGFIIRLLRSEVREAALVSHTSPNGQNKTEA